MSVGTEEVLACGVELTVALADLSLLARVTLVVSNGDTDEVFNIVNKDELVERDTM